LMPAPELASRLCVVGTERGRRLITGPISLHVIHPGMQGAAPA
jgi:hypothetical protein